MNGGSSNELIRPSMHTMVTHTLSHVRESGQEATLKQCSEAIQDMLLGVENLFLTLVKVSLLPTISCVREARWTRMLS
jgi:hypothetical protein